MWRREKITAMSVPDFMRNYTKKERKVMPKLNTPAYSLVLTPGMFIDGTFVLVCGGVVAVALIEKAIGMTGNVVVADAINTALKFLFPIAVIVLGYYLFATSPVLRFM